MPQRISSRTPLRLARNEAKLIRPGLLRLIAAHHNWQDHGASPISPARSISIPHLIDEGRFSMECQATVLHVAVVATNNFKVQSRRLRLDPIELAACILGVRTTEMMARHGHLEPRPVRCRVRCRRLPRKLERIRKRAKRAYIGVHGQAAFAEASHRWQQHVRFVRAFFLFCTCNRTILPDPAGRTHRKLIEDQWMKYFREELPARGRKIPSEAKLRGLVKRALCVGRRFIRHNGRITAHQNHDLLQEKMTMYVVRRCRESQTPEF